MQKPVALIGGVGTKSNFTQHLIDALLEHGFSVLGTARGSAGKKDLIGCYKNNADVQFEWGDLQDSTFVEQLIANTEASTGPISIYIHNVATLIRKPFLETTIDDFEKSWNSTIKSAVVVSRAILPSMLARGKGTLLFTGATASTKGNAKSAPFAVAKFGLRALSQSLAREFGPRGIHVAHIVVDGVIEGRRAQETFNLPKEQCIDPSALADLYMYLLSQTPSGWTQEIDIRPSVEKF